MRSRRRHLFALAELVEEHGEVEECRDEYLASLDADDGLAVLLIGPEEIQAAVAARRARAPALCQRCGARLPTNPHRCRRCGRACG
ncbi:MAG: hypothetical protein QOF43_765 [Gaiellaceae bacterium]|nr:hypothetical protein [Gaiellaceae bacterium]